MIPVVQTKLQPPKNNEDQEKMNNNFLTELKNVYNFIDKRTEIMWGHKNVSELVRGCKTRFGNNKCPEKQAEQLALKQEEEKWEKDTKAQFGYGEITKVIIFYFNYN